MTRPDGMNILFAHNNFPGQFHRIAAALAADTANKVVFLSQYRRRDIDAPGVIWRRVPTDAAQDDPREYRRNPLERGEKYADAMLKLAREGFKPDVVYGHVGFGCCFYAPDIFLQAAHMGYFEWYFTNEADTRFFAGKQPIPLSTRATNRRNNLSTLSALRECSVGVCPTIWQRDQHPQEFWHKLHVLHDGIDTRFFTPNEEKKKGLHLKALTLPQAEEIVTYATRGLEPYRGFHTFYRSLPAVLSARPGAHVIIMADDRAAYGAKRNDGKTWRQVLEDEVKLEKRDAARVHFLPFQPYDQYRELLRASDCHVYLTAPFVLSWSMLEAMSCGCLVVASDTEPVREVLRHGVNGILTNFWDPAALARRVADCLARKAEFAPLRTAARRTILARYDLHSLLPRHLELLRACLHLSRSGKAGLHGADGAGGKPAAGKSPVQVVAAE